MAKTINFKSNSKILEEYLKSMEIVLHEIKSENISDRFYFMKNNSVFKPINILNDVHNDFSILGTTYLSQELYKSHSTYKKLEDLDLDELFIELHRCKCNQEEFRKILSLINKKSFIIWLEKIIQKLKKMLKLLNNIKIQIQNKRESFRKIYCFFFKNLDDTHNTIIFN